MFQAEYSSGQPLRMLVDLRASVDHALGRGKALEPAAKPEAKAAAAAEPAAKLAAKAAAAAAGSSVTSRAQAGSSPTQSAAAKPKAAPSDSDVPEFEISGAPDWDADSDSQPGKKS